MCTRPNTIPPPRKPVLGRLVLGGQAPEGPVFHEAIPPSLPQGE